MPSVFNHETTNCWGIPKFSYNIFSEHVRSEANIEKTVYSNEPPALNTVQNVPNFHGSSNGYYGYHIITPSETTNNDFAMDTSDCMPAVDCTTNQAQDTPFNRVTLDRNSLGNVSRRKRTLPNVFEENCKRFRHEDAVNKFEETQPEAPTIKNSERREEDSEGRRRLEVSEEHAGPCIKKRYSPLLRVANALEAERRRTGRSGNEIELIESLLRGTHGCDMYNFRAYDL